MFDKLTPIGYISKTFGIKGQIKMNLQDDIIDVEMLVDKKIYVKTKDSYEFFIVENDQLISKKRVLTLKGIDNINQIERFVNSEIFVINDEVEIEYEVSIVGYSVYNKKLLIGEVVETLYNGHHELIKVKKIDNTYIWIPLVDRYLKEIDDDKQKIIVIDIEGL